MDNNTDAIHLLCKPDISWEEDSRYRTNPAVLTELLWEQVPVLEFVKFRVTSIDPRTIVLFFAHAG